MRSWSDPSCEWRYMTSSGPFPSSLAPFQLRHSALWHQSTRLSLSMMTDTDHVMSAKSDEYLKKVEQAEESARTTRDLSAKLMYQEIAEHYRYLAEHQIKMDGWRFDSE